MSRVGWIRLAVIVIAVGALELACRSGLIDHRVVIPPSEMTVALVRLLINGQANAAIALTFTLLRLRAGWEPHRPPHGSVADNLGHHLDDHSLSEQHLVEH